jgi:GNAT superfamily N-acetyltransferase
VATQPTEPSIRIATAADAPECGRICYHAFASIAERHGFPADFPSIETATQMISGLIAHPGFFGAVATWRGQIVGANFLDERSTIFSVGPVVVDPNDQNRGIGRALMDAVVQRGARLHPPGVRLLQAAYHNRSLSLYTKIGFQVRDSFAAMDGEPLGQSLFGYAVRPATADDAAACSELCLLVHGHDRHGELVEAVTQGSAMLVERSGRITGYTTGIGF